MGTISTMPIYRGDTDMKKIAVCLALILLLALCACFPGVTVPVGFSRAEADHRGSALLAFSRAPRRFALLGAAGSRLFGFQVSCSKLLTSREARSYLATSDCTPHSQ